MCSGSHIWSRVARGARGAPHSAIGRDPPLSGLASGRNADNCLLRSYKAAIMTPSYASRLSRADIAERESLTRLRDYCQVQKMDHFNRESPFRRMKKGNPPSPLKINRFVEARCRLLQPHLRHSSHCPKTPGLHFISAGICDQLKTTNQ